VNSSDDPAGVLTYTSSSLRSDSGTNSEPISGTRAKLPKKLAAASTSTVLRRRSDQATNRW
jgi:hypothetical protein